MKYKVLDLLDPYLDAYINEAVKRVTYCIIQKPIKMYKYGANV